VTQGAADFHDRNAEAFLAQYRSDPDFADRLGVWAAILERHAVRGGRALDLGCGGGDLTFLLGACGMAAMGVDGSAEMIRRCEEKRQTRVGAVTFVQQTLPGPVPGGPADVVMASSVLEYLPDDAATDRWLADLVKPGGLLVFSLPNADSLYRTVETARFRLTGRPAYRAHVRRMSTPAREAARFGALGFDLLQIRYYAHGPLLSRLARALCSSRRGDNLFAAVFRRRLS
jgi:2-polyprenyl-6-hydroxyphenyl methylase/3-demethylubiquinone-9 3-methyltransferase